MDSTTTYDRTKQDVSNIIALEHVNLCIPDQQLATAFYVVGLGFTRDPFKRVGLDNMGINIGRNQLHLPTAGTVRIGITRSGQRLCGTIHVVISDLDALAKRLEKVTPLLKDTQFGYEVHAEYIDATCPWGNRYRCHAPSPELGGTDLAIAYVEFDVPRGTAAGIARFYREALLARATLDQQGDDPVACVSIGTAQRLLFHETDATLPPYDGHHIQIYIANYSAPYQFLKTRGLVTEAGQQWTFKDIVDVDSGKVLFTVEHEVRCLSHPSYNKPLVNRNPAQTNNNSQVHDEFTGRI